MTIVFNTKRMTKRRKQLRQSVPSAEVLLWRHLKRRQVGGYKFRRQVSIGGYVVDFYCPALHLAIEVDGPTHYHNDIVEYDTKRQNDIESLGVQFFRITNEEVYKNIKGVEQALCNVIDII